MNIIAALGQALDFLFKAVRAYSETEEGAKELNDVIQALEGQGKASDSSQSETTSRSYRSQ